MVERASETTAANESVGSTRTAEPEQATCTWMHCRVVARTRCSCHSPDTSLRSLRVALCEHRLLLSLHSWLALFTSAARTVSPIDLASIGSVHQLTPLHALQGRRIRDGSQARPPRDHFVRLGSAALNPTLPQLRRAQSQSQACALPRDTLRQLADTSVLNHVQLTVETDCAVLCKLLIIVRS